MYIYTNIKITLCIILLFYLPIICFIRIFSNRPPPSLGTQLPIPSCLKENNTDDQDVKGQKRKYTDFLEGGNYNFY